MSSPYLYISSNGSSRRVDVGEEPVTIGRQIANMIVIEDTEASRFHCVVEKVAAGYRVRDLGSRNGTKVGGKIVKVALLDDGDVITIGKTEMKLVLSESSAPAARSAGKQRHAASSSSSGARGSSSVTQMGKPAYPMNTDDGVEDGNSLEFGPSDDNSYGGGGGGAIEQLDESDFGPIDIDNPNSAGPGGGPGSGMGHGPEMDSGAPPNDSLLRM